eukprot:CAMPEP_0176345920 /NCGR_PEP_ID=MMETSP0126-20121128/5840_1 /TAXON_ID=141414 ORGANISM="Strombidinopsis acuminatum, Strain SPMC142" /NCGR_SAMPLE_ID=MMETSP0126 /ASSEMBLY_ACC=CAM_ASM_000229 /LENGTH=103 /DNA_ID=CAMNT_0017693179 /DNA_START=2990 /DNA_END=3301 /DNA_ORIENTATION=-
MASMSTKTKGKITTKKTGKVTKKLNKLSKTQKKNTVLDVIKEVPETITQTGTGIQSARGKTGKNLKATKTQTPKKNKVQKKQNLLAKKKNLMEINDVPKNQLG